MQVLIISNNLHCGGTEVVLQKLCAELALRGDRLTIWACNGDKKTLAEHYPAGTKLRRLPFWDEPCRKWTAKWIFNRACRVLFEGFLLKIKKWDLLIAFKEGPSMRLGAGLRAGRKIGWVHTDFASFHWSACNFHSGEDERQCMTRYDSVICVSDAVKAGLVEAIGDPGNLCVRYNPIDHEDICQRAQSRPADCIPPADRPLFVSVGRLSEVKRYDMLIDICRKLERRYAFELWIIGGGELEAKLREKLRAEGVESVRLFGRRDNPYPYMACADYVVSASSTESYGLTLQEALILGVPVIACRFPAIDESVDSRFGMITGQSEAELEAAMSLALEKPELAGKYREAVRSGYDKNCLWQQRMEEILGLLLLQSSDTAEGEKSV